MRKAHINTHSNTRTQRNTHTPHETQTPSSHTHSLPLPPPSSFCSSSRYYLRSLSEKLSDSEIDASLGAFNKGGKVKYEEYVNSLFR